MTLEQRIRRLELFFLGDEKRDGYTWEEIQEAYYAKFPERLQQDVQQHPRLQTLIDHPPHPRLALRWARVKALYMEPGDSTPVDEIRPARDGLFRPVEEQDSGSWQGETGAPPRSRAAGIAKR